MRNRSINLPQQVVRAELNTESAGCKYETEEELRRVKKSILPKQLELGTK